MTMRSIRHSLIVYFVLLMTAALGAVSWYSYQTTARSLREHQRDARNKIEAQCDASCKSVGDDLDRRILRQAQMMVNLSRSMLVHTEGMYQFGAIGVAATQQGFFHAPFLMALGTHHIPFTPPTARAQLITYVESADDLIPAVGSEHGQEYFQTYRRAGQPWQRSKSMGDHWFQLEEEVQKKATLLTEQFDDAELTPGTKVRRVTLKVTVPRTATMWVPWPWKGMPFSWRNPSPQSNPKGPPPPKSPKASPPFRPMTNETVAPTVFIQYASDLAPVEAKIRELRRDRDTQLQELDDGILRDLQQLRSRMAWIGFAALGALWFGGYVVIRMGLSPLARMSEAVSKISPQNFQFSLDEAKLPQELQPIADRLIVVLEQLRNAFAREKQAAADISHELRTPLAALMTTLDVGLRRPRTTREYQEILSECRGSGQHMYQLVERLLTLARLDAGAEQYRGSEVDAIELALQCSDLIRPLARARSLALRLNLPPDAVVLQTDPNKLREVLINLLHNAVEYNRPDGSIDLSVEVTDGKVKIEVRDTGIGIAPDTLEHIFERFYRADPSRHADTPHAGLGLSIVKSYVDLMGGVIRVASSDAGTVFTIELPHAQTSNLVDASSQNEQIHKLEAVN